VPFRSRLGRQLPSRQKKLELLWPSSFLLLLLAKLLGVLALILPLALTLFLVAEEQMVGVALPLPTVMLTLIGTVELLLLQ
jgi:hypothetical protein